MAAGAAVRTDWPECRQEALGMTGRLAAAQRAFPLPGGVVRVLRPIVAAPMAPMLDPWQHLLLRCLVAAELGGDQHARDILAPLEEFAEALFGGGLIAADL